jgi:hypothetical protein
MYLIIFISASVILYQYHLSNAWLISQTSTQDFRVLNAKNSEKIRNVTTPFNASSISNTNTSYPNTTALCFQPKNKDIDLPPLYIITPTYRRPEQLAELTRLSHTLMLVKNIFWVVIEDAVRKTQLVTELLEKTGLKYEHLIGICRPLQVFKCCVMLSIFQHPCQNSIKRRKKDPNPEAFPTGTGD